MVNPYTGQDFFGFFKVLIFRVFSGNIIHLASDEVQILVLMGVALSGAIVGTFLVLRNMTMVANALSHTILVGIVGAYLLLSGSLAFADITLLHLTLASLIAGLITTFCIEFLNKVVGLQEDAAVGLVFTSLFALGILMVTLFTKNLHLSLELVMGNVDALVAGDLKIVYGVLCLNAGLIFLFFKEFKLTTFDGAYASSFGISPGVFNSVLMILTSATVMSALRAVGVLMVLAFLVGPTLIARLCTHRLSHLLAFASAIGCGAAFVGVALSRHILTKAHFGLSTSGIVVCVITLCFLLVVFRKKVLTYS